MAKTPQSMRARGYVLQSKLAEKPFITDERKLPNAKLGAVVEMHTPSSFLRDILQYARGAESRGEWLFRERWLKPYMKKFVELNEQNSMWEDGMGNLVAHIGANPWDTLHVGHIDSVHSDDLSPYQEILEEDRVIGKGTQNEATVKYWTLKPLPKNSKRVVKQGTWWKDDVQHKYEYLAYELPTDTARRCLGADDGCAVAIMLYLMANQVEGTYVFTRGEERGCVGTHYMLDKGDLDFSVFKRAIEVDRKGTDEIIGEMGVGICASREFVEQLSAQLNMGHKYSDKGSITDVGHMASLIPECVNVAAGYWKQHSAAEECVPKYLDLLGARLKDVDFDALPTQREAGMFRKPVTKSPTRNGAYDDWDWNGYTGEGARGGKSGSYPKKGVHSTRTAWGDYTVDVLDKDEYLDEHFATEFAMDGWIRGNINLVRNLLLSLNLSFKEMDFCADFGLRKNLEIDYPVDEEEEESDAKPTEETKAEDTDTKSESEQEDTNGDASK